jgi:hypothetical protein
MTRHEALRRLEGTWAFEAVPGGVRVADPELLALIEDIERERHTATLVASLSGRPLARDRASP